VGCGYDDHALPPVRGGGNQAFHIGSTSRDGRASLLLARDITGRGQHVDVSIARAANVTTESGSYEWTGGSTARCCAKTGRTRYRRSPMPTDALRDGLYVTTGFPAACQREFEALVDWIDTRYREEFEDIVLLDLAIERGGVAIAELSTDDLALRSSAPGERRSCTRERITAESSFRGGQTRGLACGVVASPEARSRSEHFVARGPVEVEHENLGRSFRYPGAPFLMPGVAVAIFAPRSARRRARRRDPRELIAPTHVDSWVPRSK